MSASLPNQHCIRCGGLYPARRPGYCSDECRRATAREKQRVRDAAKKTLRLRICHQCGCEFTPQYGDKRRRFCSQACQKVCERRIRRVTTRARRFTATVESIDPLDIFARDDWRCRLCGIDTPRSLLGTHSDAAPEMDHVIPLSQGGEHSAANVQCLCHRCNRAKGNSVSVEGVGVKSLQPGALLDPRPSQKNALPAKEI